MRKIIVNNTAYIVGYHTQECRIKDEPLESPIKCIGKNAWLGIGYYFWTLTLNSGYEAIMLPSFNFIKMSDDKENVKQP